MYKNPIVRTRSPATHHLHVSALIVYVSTHAINITAPRLNGSCNVARESEPRPLKSPIYPCKSIFKHFPTNACIDASKCEVLLSASYAAGNFRSVTDEFLKNPNKKNLNPSPQLLHRQSPPIQLALWAATVAAVLVHRISRICMRTGVVQQGDGLICARCARRQLVAGAVRRSASVSIMAQILLRRSVRISNSSGRSSRLPTTSHPAHSHRPRLRLQRTVSAEWRMSWPRCLRVMCSKD